MSTPAPAFSLKAQFFSVSFPPSPVLAVMPFPPVFVFMKVKPSMATVFLLAATFISCFVAAFWSEATRTTVCLLKSCWSPLPVHEPRSVRE